ncbi:eukaryotic translation initiation factor 2 [Cichlidogyrus casuarinus]|uniref:Eukaryotic translation initiation factor 2 subunit 2 n=1 Tax=Cichlidogyrus casuarinus TaxID=1844966 RepID=A0ABD2Q301_9PLAT
MCDSEELNLGAKKKKKSSVLKSNETGAEKTAEAEDDEALMAELKTKKKKKKTEIALTVEDITEKMKDMGTNEQDDDDDDDLMAELKSAKKKKKTIENKVELEDLDGQKKKKKKPIEDLSAISMEEQSKMADAAGYSYDFLLTRAFEQLQLKNPELFSEQSNKLAMAPPQLARIGSKKTSFSNFAMACKVFNRDPSHLSAFICSELGTTGSVDSKGALIIRGRYFSKHIEPLLNNYCRTYVKCATCQSPKTVLDKDSRLLFVHCLQCHSKITVKNVSTGFQAVTGKRAALRAKAAAS